MSDCQHSDDIKDIKDDVRSMLSVQAKILNKLATHQTIITFAKWGFGFFCSSLVGFSYVAFNSYLLTN